jgi:hypothetical protein
MPQLTRQSKAPLRETPPSVGLLAVAALLFCAGLSALIFQVAWLRELRLIFGTSTAATAAVLAIFMGGLGIGNWLLGPRADCHSNPLKLYSSYLLLIAVSGAISPWLCDAARWVYIALSGQTAMGIAAASVARLAASAFVLGLPTILMGGTLPAAVRVATSADDRSRRGLAEPFAAEALYEERCRALLRIGEAAGPNYAREDLDRFEPNVPWEADFLQRRAEVYAKAGDPRAWQAKQDAEDFKRNEARQGTR